MSLRELPHLRVWHAGCASAEDHARLSGAVSAILQKSEFSHDELLAELRRVIDPRKPD